MEADWTYKEYSLNDYLGEAIITLPYSIVTAQDSYYIHKPEWYLQIDAGRDNRVEIMPNNIDLVGWEVRKA